MLWLLTDLSQLILPGTTLELVPIAVLGSAMLDIFFQPTAKHAFSMTIFCTHVPPTHDALRAALALAVYGAIKVDVSQALCIL